MNLGFFINSILLGAGLAMDAFSVSIANGLSEPDMSWKRMLTIAGTYACFQTLMPLLGWFFVRSAAQRFAAFQRAIPWIALILLAYIGGKMVVEGVRGMKSDEDEADEDNETETAQGSTQRSTQESAQGDSLLSMRTLLLQGVATSIDALSVGFTIANYGFIMALAASLIIGGVTLALCLIALKIGGVFGKKLADKATVAGGILLILIGVEIWATNIFL